MISAIKLMDLKESWFKEDLRLIDNIHFDNNCVIKLMDIPS